MTEWNGGAGPRIVAIGGGTGLSTMLRGLKSRTRSLTAIVTVADDGGGSGMLRQDLGMPPPGDIRHCMEALANAEPVMQQLLTYRFPEGSGNLTGQSFGNLILAALNGISDSFDQAVARMSEVLAISGRVLPVTNENVALEATFENGTRVLGESKISAFKKEQDCRIESVRLLPEHPKALPEAVRAIGEAELILLGPGSLYTSVIPNLLVDGIADAVRTSDALKIYICNIMTQDGETEGMTASDHVKALLDHSGPGLVDLCLCNSAPVRPGLVERYREEDAAPIVVEEQDCRIESVRLLPEHPKALPEAVRAIGEAELILLGPGSLYTSVIPNLLVDGIADAVRTSDALKIYICNIMTQDGETEGMTASDHVKALLDHSGPGLVDLCLCNSAPVRPGLVERYREEDAAPIVVDRAAIEALGVEAVTRPLASETLNYARHSFTRLADAVMELYNERADTKIF